MNAKNTTALAVKSRTDWARLERRDDAEIDYSDAPPMKTAKRRRMRVRLPNGRRLPVK